MPEDEENGLLVDAGEKLLYRKIVFTGRGKDLDGINFQGYYDVSGTCPDNDLPAIITAC